MDDKMLDCIAVEMARVDANIDAVCNSGNPQLSEMCRYVLANHGKRIRPAVCLLSYYVSGGEKPQINEQINVAAAIEILHNATLIHDDINDKGELRRGAKALYLKYSISKSIVAGDYLYAMGFRLVGSSNQHIVDYILNAATGLANGEFVQKNYEHNPEINEENYFEIIGGKTARLFEAQAKCGAFFGQGGEKFISPLGEFGRLIGCAFQIVDDILDVSGSQGATGKQSGTDIIDGKPTLPIIYAMKDSVHGKRIKEIFESKEADRKTADEAISLIQKTDAIDKCLSLAKEYQEKAKKILEDLPSSLYLDALRGTADLIVSRDR